MWMMRPVREPFLEPTGRTVRLVAIMINSGSRRASADLGRACALMGSESMTGAYEREIAEKFRDTWLRFCLKVPRGP